MLENPPILSKKVNRAYISLDKPFNMCIIEYNWSTTEPEWVMEKMVWNTWNDTQIGNSLRDGKYVLGII